MAEERVTPTPENPIPDVDEIKPGIPTPAWPDEGGGGGGGVLLKVGVTVEEGVATMDKTWAEINTAFNSGIVFVILFNEADHGNYLYIVDVVGVTGEGTYGVGLRNIEMITSSFFIASSADGYPVCNDF